MKIISISRGFCADHSAADYVFISLRKLSKQEIKKAEKLWEKKTMEEAYGEEERISVGEYGFSHESWYSFLSDLEDEFMVKFFDIGIKRNEIGGGETIKFRYDYDEELYKKLEMCAGYGKNFAHIYVKKKEKRIILEIDFDIDAYDVFEYKDYDEFTRLFHKFLEGIREDILRGDLTALRCVGQFYSIKAGVNWKALGKPTERAIILKKMLRRYEE